MTDVAPRTSPFRLIRLPWRAVLMSLSVSATVGLHGAPLDAQERVTVVATTDVHGRAMHWDYVTDREAPWGLTRAATAVDSMRRAGERVVLVDAGDLLQGNLFGRFFGTVRPVSRNPMVDALNAMQYDAFTPGNHDFDFGIPFLDTALAHAQFNVVSTNIYNANRLAFREYVSVQRGAVRVGITGGTTVGTAVWNRDQLRNRRVVGPIIPGVQRALTRMTQDGMHLKIVVLHSGLGPGGSGAVGGEPENIAAQLAYLPIKPDLVVMGHTHRSVRDTVINGVHFIQAGAWATGLAVAKVTMGQGGNGALAPVTITGSEVSLAGVRPDPDLVRRLSESHEAARSWGAIPVGVAPAGWRSDFARAMDTPLVDFINHVQLVATGAQLSATASYPTRGGFDAGQIRNRDVHGVYPFENTLKMVQITGNELRQYLEHSATYFRAFDPASPIINTDVPGYNYDMISGVDYVFDLSMPMGSRVRQLVYQGQIVRPDDRFTLAVNNYRHVAGGFNLTGLPVLAEFDSSVFALLVDEIRRVGSLVTESYFKPNWNIVPETAATAVRIAFGATDSSATERRAFRVVATTDLHGALLPRLTSWSNGRPVGGVAALGAQIDSLAAECACPAIILDAGGAIGGSLSADRMFGSSMIAAMNMMRYDAAAIGESELQWGIDSLRARIASASFPFLAANTRIAGAMARPDWARDWVMVERGGARIAVVGVTGSVSSAVALAPPERFLTTDMAAAVNGAISQARASGAEHVVVLAHAEAHCDSEGCRGPLIDFMQNLQPGSVDLVVGGHSDSEAATVVNGNPLLLPGSEGLSVGIADVMVAPDGSRRAISSVATVWADSGSRLESLVSLANTARAPADSIVTNTVLPISAGGDESGIGRLIADAYRTAARAHVAIVHNTTINGDLPTGPVRYEDIYAAQPVRHTVHRMLVRGDVIREVLEQVLSGAAPTAHVSGVEVEYDPNGRPGDRIRRIRLSGDRGFSGGDMYWLAVSDFMARGGGGYEMLSGFEAESVGVSDFQALANYLGQLPRPVDAPRNRRLQPR